MSVWLQPERRGRDKPSLTRARIVEEAVALLDEEGVAGLTMRRLAERLDAGPTTLYWHVPTKDDVIDLALDAIFADVPIPRRPSRDWRRDVRALVSAWHAAMLRHGWSAALLGRPLLGPNVLARTEHLQATLRRAGLREPHLTAGTHAIADYAIGSAVTRSSWERTTDPELRRAARDHLRAHRDDYPTLHAHGHLDDRDEDRTFALGLDYLLDGLARHAGAGDGDGTGTSGR
ncbi:TetR/AcrR family transcriptional regulator [Conexibacter arvalis]|uniref:AcrR family transcriptional regulator n=1 Tax=Conexibacter arvalis TaxID=912552 RepID=A0A840IBD4_9ACTN|nr:TetR/AcrR family transcriptional regulator C-terminal domain-containing protein [Conexibacter arvalis]MBB4662146.1 AcrR family transcriptional regulator [Conexibacter arvalis]